MIPTFSGGEGIEEKTVRDGDRGTHDRADRRLQPGERGLDGRSIRDEAGMAGERAVSVIGAGGFYGIGGAGEAVRGGFAGFGIVSFAAETVRIPATVTVTGTGNVPYADSVQANRVIGSTFTIAGAAEDG